MTFSVAVIGSGMAGLAAAHGCRRNGHSITTFEAADGHGMDTHAMEIEGGLVDVPLRVMNTDTWPSVLELAEEVGVSTFKVRTPVSCSNLDRETWFRSGEVPGLGLPTLGSWRYLNRSALRMGRGLWQLNRLARTLRRADPDLTVGELLAREPVDSLFWRGLMLPVLNTICTCEEEHLLQWPASQLLPLVEGMIRGPSFRRLKGGTSALVQGLSRGLKLYSASPVTTLRIEEHGVRVLNQRGEGGLFDRVIVATQANHLQFLDDQQFAEERAVLSDIRFDSGELWVHQDQRFMPERPAEWTTLNFQMDDALCRPMFTVWVNQVEPSLSRAAPVFQTWNPLYDPDPDQVLARVPLERAVVHAGTRRVHQQLHAWHRQPGRKVFFCGSWAHEGVPLLESAVRSAREVVDLIG